MTRPSLTVISSVKGTAGKWIARPVDIDDRHRARAMSLSRHQPTEREFIVLDQVARHVEGDGVDRA